MKIESLLVRTGTDPPDDELHARVVDRTPQGDALTRGKAMELDQFGPYDGALLVIYECLPLGIRHLQLRHDFVDPVRIDRKVGKEILFILPDAAKPAKAHDSLNPRHGRDLCLLRQGQ